MNGAKLTFYGEIFDFDILEYTGTSLICRLKLDEEQEALYFRLRDEECAREQSEGAWYLDARGNRLATDDLFAASPWCLHSSAETVKLLARKELIPGEIHFNTPDGYGGELFDWVSAERRS